jgi:cytochrome c-type biogenesis protein CcmH/NrfG
MGTQDSAGKIAGCTSRRHKIGLGRALSGSESILVAAALLLGVPSYGAAQQSSSKASSMQPSSTASVKLQQAEELMQQGRLDEANVKVQKELAQQPSSVDGLNLLGIIAATQQDYAGGEAAFQQALQVAPNSIKTHVNLGNVYVVEKKFEPAEKEFRTVLKADPANRDANYNLGVLLMAKGAAAEAIPHFQRVRPRRSGSSTLRRVRSTRPKRSLTASRTATWPEDWM